MEEIKPIIRVDVGESEQTVKGLKKEISDLKDRILNLKKGSDDYNTAVEQLQADQRKLNEVMALTKKEAVAVEGSYDALTHQMSLLKKEWRATADEAKRADLGKQIDEINQQLKEMDASVGNFQRNVGNYVSHWEGMPEVTKDFGTAMREMNEQIEPTKQKFESVGKIASGLAAGFATVQGAAALLGVENEDLEKTMVKLQAANSLVAGAKGIGDLVEGLGKAKVAFQGLGTTVKSVSKAMGASGWIAVILLVVGAIAGLVTWIKKTKDETDKYNLSLKEQKELQSDLASSMNDVVAEFKTFQRQYSSLKTDDEKKRWIEENASAFNQMGLEINSVNSADKVFITQSDEVIAALKARAKAEALMDKYKEAVKKGEDQKVELQGKQVRGILTGDGKLPEGLNPDDWQYEWGGGQSGAGIFKPKTDAANDYLDAQLKAQEQVIDDQIEAIWGTRLGEAEKEAKAAEAKVSEYIKKDNKGGNNKGGGNKDKKKTIEELLKEVSDKLYEEAANMEIEDIPIEVDTDITLKDEEKKLGIYEKLANERIAYYERVAQREIDLNSVSELSAEEKAQKELEIKQKLEEDKLRILQEFKQKADGANDWISSIELQQDIADQEVAIQVEKNRRIIESDEERKEKQTKIIGDVSAALSAAGQLTQGIMEIAQAKAEEDGEISEEEAKKIKGLQYATATINMLQGAITAFSSAMQLGPIIGPILGGGNAAAVIAMGTANLMRIKNTDLTGKVSSGPQAAVTPNSNVYGTDIPFSYTKQVTGASEIDALNQDTRVYILESDIQESNRKVQVRESESSF